MLEFLGIAAAAAEVFYGASAHKSFAHSGGAGRLENVGQLLPKNISKTDAALAVQAARHNRSVAKNAELIFQTVAEHPVTLVGGVFVRPGKAVAPFQKNLIPDAQAPGIFCPFPWEKFLQKLHGGKGPCKLSLVVGMYIIEINRLSNILVLEKQASINARTSALIDPLIAASHNVRR